MEKNFDEIYKHVRSGETGYIEVPRGLIAVWGKEAVQFLDGMITNDLKTLADGVQMLAAFPNAQGRLLAVVRVLRQGNRFLIDTEEATREKVFQNLFRFTFAGDFFVEDLSEQYRYFEVFGSDISSTVKLPKQSEPSALAGGFLFKSSSFDGLFVSTNAANSFRQTLIDSKVIELSGNVYETLRIESGIPKYGVDMDENTIVPELGLKGMISYSKGCYIGQEIIARIHFRGHVAKQLTGLVSEREATGFLPDTELTTTDGKNAGRITSITFSPGLEKTIALAYVRYDHLAAGTELNAGDNLVTVNSLPFH